MRPIDSSFFLSSSLVDISCRWMTCMLKSAVRTCSEAVLRTNIVAMAMPTPVSTDMMREVYLGRSFKKVMRFLPSFMPITSPAHETKALTIISAPSSIQFMS